MSKGNPFLALRLAPATLECLRELSARQGRTVSEVARAALARGLAAEDASASAVSALAQDHRPGSRRPARPRKLTRHQRASQATEELRQLLTEYTDWLESLPEFAQGTATAHKLQAAVEEMEEALDALDQLNLPRGLGRD